MDFSKAFDNINHDLLIANSMRMEQFLFSYLTNRFQRTKVINSFSSWSELIRSVPRESALGPALLNQGNIHLNDFLYVSKMADVCNYAHDTTFHA